MVGKNKIKVRLLQFTDDILFFSDAHVQNIKVIKVILKSFELVLGLKVNFSKTKVSGVGLNKEFMQKVSTILNCENVDIPFEYIGMPIGGNPRKK